MTPDELLIWRVLSRITDNLGGGRPADEQIAKALGVTSSEVLDWRVFPLRVPLEYRVRLGLWLEDVGRQSGMDEWRKIGNTLRTDTRRRQAGHVAEALALFEGLPEGERWDRAWAHAAACYVVSPPPAPPTIEDHAVLGPILDQLLAYDEAHLRRSSEADTGGT